MSKETTHVSGIRKILMMPLTVYVLGLLIAVVLGFVGYAQFVLGKSLERRINGVELMFKEEVASDSNLIKGLLEDVVALPCAAPTFLDRNRDALFDCSQPLFTQMRAQHQITHFYFHTTEKVNFLRVHHPVRHSDTITRFTLDMAVSSNDVVDGLEIGPYGTFVLRVVMPWTVDGTVIGYLELGKEIDDFIPEIKKALTADLVILVSKTLTTRETWEEGQRMLGNKEDWTEYEEMIVVQRTTQVWSPEFNVFGHEHNDEMLHDTVLHITQNDRLYHVSALPLRDVRKKNVGHIVVLIDVSEEQRQLFLIIAITVGSVLAISLLFAGYLWRNIGRFEGALLGTQNRYNDLLQQKENINTTLQEKQRMLHLNESMFRRSIIEKQTLIELLYLTIQPTTMNVYLEAALKRLLESLTWVEHLPEAVIFLVRYENGRPYLQQVANYNLSTTLITRCDRIELGECLCGRAAQSETIIFSAHVDEQHDISFDEMSAHGHWVVPIKHEGSLLGVFNIYVPDGTHHDERTESFLSEVARVLAGGIYQRLQHTIE